MANKRAKNGDIVKILGKEYKIGNLYRNNLLQKYESSEVQSIVDIDTEKKKGSYNFHFFLTEDKEEEILKEVCSCIDQVLKYIADNLKDSDIKIETNHKNNNDGSINRKCGYIRMEGEFYSHLFRYIWVSINDIKYELNFMRFFIENENEINCILESAQFDRCYTRYINSDGVCYPETPFEQINELDNIIYVNRKKNFCYNPASSIFDAENLAQEFVEFIRRCERDDGGLEKPENTKELYIMKKTAIDFPASCLIKLNRSTKHLEFYHLSTDNSILHDYYPIRKDFDSSDYLMYEKEKEFPCIWGGGDTPTPEGIFQIEKVSEAHEEYVSGYYTGHDKVKFFGYLVVFEDYFIHSNLYTEEATQDTFEQMKPVNGAEEHSSGCIRLAQKDLDWLVENVEVGTTVVM